MASFGILTYFNYYNYGSMLQGFATQQIINNSLINGDYSKIINYRYQAPDVQSKFKRLLLRFSRLGYYVLNFREIATKKRYRSKLQLRQKYFDSFVDEYTEVTSEFYHNKKELEYNTPHFDVYIVGSDQTWSPKVSGGYNETPMLLDYIGDNKYKCAYAPSLGVTSISLEDAEHLKKSLFSFSVLSCREEKGAQILNEILDKDVPVVLDPTLLLDAGKWKSISRMPSICIGGYILCYFLGDKTYYRRFAQRLSDQTGLPIYYIPVCWVDCKSENNLLFEVGPREFIGLISNAKYVLTDSFHGTAFSINLNKQFYSFVKHDGGIKAGDNSRIYDFLHRLGLSDRLISKYSTGPINIKEIDFSQANQIIASDRLKSQQVISQIVSIPHK